MSEDTSDIAYLAYLMKQGRGGYACGTLREQPQAVLKTTGKFSKNMLA